MATFSQLLGTLQAEQQLGQKLTQGVLGEEVFKSESMIKEGDRLYQEAAQQAGLDIGEYQQKGKEIDTATTLLAAAVPAAAPLIALGGFFGKKSRSKPKFRFDLEQAVPGFENRLFAKQRGEDLMSSVEGTRANVSRALESSLLSDVLGIGLNLYGSYQLGQGFGTVPSATEDNAGASFLDFLKGDINDV